MTDKKKTADNKPEESEIAEAANSVTDAPEKDEADMAGTVASEPVAADENAEQTEEDTPASGRREQMIIVGIGASAGGLEALKELISHLPSSDMLTYVIAQHLSPNHPSLLMELLIPSTELRVREAKTRQVPEPGCIYVTPPNQDVEIVNGVLRLIKPQASVGPKPSVDRFFKSLAESQGENTVGIILSGTGSDGANGIRSIKAAGGITIVQDPQVAKYDGMPRAATQTGCVDLVLPCNKIGTALEALAMSPAISQQGLLPEPPSDDYGKIIALVKKATGFDLGQYKSSTVERRVRRRMGLRGHSDLATYLKLLGEDAAETEQLAKDILISVTSFMRDPQAFDALAGTIRKIVESKQSGEVVRCWVAGCATGEEAYSIAILLAEAVRKVSNAPEFLLFATDIDQDAVEFARSGIYPASTVEHLPAEYRKRYMEKIGGHYRVKKFLRQNMVFATQNVVEDPPFSRTELISCRNLLIYLTRSVQRRVMDIFHYALNPGGYLFLGKSESIDAHRELFEAADKTSRIFRRLDRQQVYVSPATRDRSTKPEILGRSKALPNKESVGESTEILLKNAVFETYCPPAVLLNEKDEIVRLHGEVGKFLKLGTGEVRLGIFDLIDAKLRAELRALLHRCRRERMSIQGASVNLQAGEAGTAQMIQPAVHPVLQGDQVWVVLAFEEARSPLMADTDSLVGADRDNLIISELERELASTREHLQTVVEELETSNEELQSQSEELQSSNEELQSTNEELQTANEELQSTNEELLTVNDELQSKSHELEETAATMHNIKESLDFPMMVINRKLQITQMNAACSTILRTAATEPTPSVTDADWSLDLTPVLTSVRSVLKDGMPIEQQVKTDIGNPLQMRAMPYRIEEDGAVEGAVLTFIDTTDRDNSEQLLIQEKERFSITLQSIADGVITTDAESRIVYMNPGAERMLDMTANDALGKELASVYQSKDDDTDTELENALTLAMRKGEPVERVDMGHVLCSHKGYRHMVDESATPIFDSNKQVVGGVLVFRDVSEQRLLAEELSYRATHDPLTGLANRTEFERNLRNLYQQSKRENVKHAMLFIDLDQFKLVNDAGGHSAGDELLRNVGSVMRSALRQSDLLSRLGGDEFAALLSTCSISEAEKIATNMLSALSEIRFDWDGRVYKVAASIGIASIDAEAYSVAQIMSSADAACYTAKDKGRNRYYVTTSEEVIKRQGGELAMMAEIDLALDDGRLVFCAEDVVHTSNRNKIIYRELLSRLRSREGTLMAPGTFIPVAERYFTTANIDRHVVDLAFQMLSGDLKDDGYVYSVNLSGQMIGDLHMLSHIEKKLDQYAIEGERICFEITETAAVSHLHEAVRFIRRLKERGCRFAMDDFGSGMASFAYLKTLPFDFIKIDGSFIRDISKGGLDRTMVEAVARIGRDLGITTIAEQVETEQSLKILEEIGIDGIQGWINGKGTLLAMPKR